MAYEKNKVLEKVRADMDEKIAGVARLSCTVQVTPLPFLSELVGGEPVYGFEGSAPPKVDKRDIVHIPLPIKGVVVDQLHRGLKTVDVRVPEQSIRNNCFVLRGDFCSPFQQYRRAGWWKRKVQ